MEVEARSPFWLTSSRARSPRLVRLVYGHGGRARVELFPGHEGLVANSVQDAAANAVAADGSERRCDQERYDLAEGEDSVQGFDHAELDDS